MLNNYPTSNSYMIHIADEMKQVFEGTRSELINAGYSPCGACKP